MEKYFNVLQKLNNVNKFRGMKLTLENMSKMSKVIEIIIITCIIITCIIIIYFQVLGHPENDL